MSLWALIYINLLVTAALMWRRAGISPLRCTQDPPVHSGWSKTPRASTPGRARRVELCCSPTYRRHSCLAGRREHPTTEGKDKRALWGRANGPCVGQQTLVAFSLVRVLQIDRGPEFYSQTEITFIQWNLRKRPKLPDKVTRDWRSVKKGNR